MLLEVHGGEVWGGNQGSGRDGRLARQAGGDARLSTGESTAYLGFSFSAFRSASSACACIPFAR